MRLLLGAWPGGIEGIRDGDMPKTMVMGFVIGEDDREMGPLRRSRTADRRGGYQVEDVGARVEKSRI